MDVSNAGRQLVEDLFPDEIAQFADSACDACDAVSNLLTYLQILMWDVRWLLNYNK